MKKLTAKEIIKRLKNSGISVSEYAYEGVEDFDLFNDYSEELKVHIEKQENQNYQEQKWYEKEVLGGKSVYSMKKAEFEAKGSPKLVGKVVEIDQVGGVDEGSHWHSVKHFVDHDVYIKTIGYYQSYNGTEFYEGFGKEVFPTQKTITVYE